MKLSLWILPVLSAFAVALAVDERASEAVLAADTIAYDPESPNSQGFSAVPASNLQEQSAAAICNDPNYPRYCKTGKFCCPARDNGCCPRARKCVVKGQAQCCGNGVCGIRQTCCPGSRCCPYTNGNCCVQNKCCPPGQACCISGGSVVCSSSGCGRTTAHATGGKAIAEAGPVFDLDS